MKAQYRVALAGFGMMGQGYGQDQKMATYYKYTTHAQVLRDHPLMNWRLVIDVNEQACELAKQDWQVPLAFTNIADLGVEKDEIDILVISTPPDQRSGLIDAFPNLKAVLIEKPIASELEASREFADYCAERRLFTQVNFWRRADPTIRMLASGGLQRRVGDVQCVFVTYGNGLWNNGTHMIDLARMFFGDIEAVQRIPSVAPQAFGPIPGDTNPAFIMKTAAGCSITVMPLAFEHYRENSMDIWGTKGRLVIMNEGLTIQHYPSASNRAMTDTREILQDEPVMIESSVGVALFSVYDDLVESLRSEGSPCSTVSSAVRNTEIVEAILAAPEDGRLCPTR